MPWPEFVTTQFDIVNRSTTDESEYYGPFNTLLIALFPPTENFEVVPQFKRIKGALIFTNYLHHHEAKGSCVLPSRSKPMSH